MPRPRRSCLLTLAGAASAITALALVPNIEAALFAALALVLFTEPVEAE